MMTRTGRTAVSFLRGVARRAGEGGRPALGRGLVRRCSGWRVGLGVGALLTLAGCSVPVGPERVVQPIGGTYSVTLEPVESGQGLVFRGLAQVRQRGRGVEGTLVLVGGCVGVAPTAGAPAVGTGRETDAVAPPADCVLPLTGTALEQGDGWELSAPPIRFVLRAETGAELQGPWRTETATRVLGGRSRWIPLR